MSLTQVIWKAAYAAFKREVYKAWPQICDRWEHALFLWNDQHGPLNAEQRQYVGELVVSSLEWAGKHPADQRYARFHASLNAKLNHERVQAGFRQRADREPAELGLDLGLQLKAVPA